MLSIALSMCTGGWYSMMETLLHHLFGLKTGHAAAHQENSTQKVESDDVASSALHG